MCIWDPKLDACDVDDESLSKLSLSLRVTDDGPGR